MRQYVIIGMVGGAPNLADGRGSQLPYLAYSMGAHIGQDWGLYLISGTAAQITAITALSQVYQVCADTELDDAIADATRTRLNSWLSDRSYPQVDPGTAYRQVVNAIYRRANPAFRLSVLSVQDR